MKRRSFLKLLGAIAVVGTVPSILWPSRRRPHDCYWKGGAIGRWADKNNWEGRFRPRRGDNVHILKRGTILEGPDQSGIELASLVIGVEYASSTQIGTGMKYVDLT